MADDKQTAHKLTAADVEKALFAGEVDAPALLLRFLEQPDAEVKDAPAGAITTNELLQKLVVARRKGGKATVAAAASARRAWPNTLPEQMRGVAGVLTASARPIPVDVIEAAFTGRGPWKRRIPQILEALAALGRARVVNGLWTLG